MFILLYSYMVGKPADLHYTLWVMVSKHIRKMEISLMSYCVLIALIPKFSLILT